MRTTPFTPTVRFAAKKRRALLQFFFLLALLASGPGSQAQWTTDSLSQDRAELSSASAGGKVFFAGGVRGFLESSSRVDIYDTATNQWSTASLSVARAYLSAASAGGKVFFAGGTGLIGGAISAVVDIYDVATNQWTTANLSVARGWLSATSAGGKVFFAGGDTGNSSSAVVDIYDVATNQWTTASLSVARSGLSATSVGSKVFFAGGASSAVVDIYDVATNQWTTANLSVARYDLSATSAGGKVFFAGGQVSGSGSSAVVDIYDTATNQWTTASLSVARANLSATSVGSKVFFAGGVNIDSSSSRIDIYDTATNQWTTASLSQARRNLAAASAGDKAFFAGGGVDYGFFTGLVDVFALTQSACLGGSVSTTAQVTGTGTLTYQWFRHQPDADEPVAGQTSATLSLSNLQPDDAGTYYLRASGEGGEAWSEGFTLTVNVPPAVSISGLAASYCQNDLVVTLAGSPAGGRFTLDGTAATEFNPATAGVGNHTVVYTYTDANGCTSSASQSVGLVAPAFGGRPTVSGVPACPGTPIAVAFAFSCPGQTSFQVQLSSSTGDFAQATTLTGTLSDTTLTVSVPPGTEPGTGYRVRVVVAGSALVSAESAAFALGTGPAAGVSTPASVCLGQALAVTFSAGVCAPTGVGYTAQLSNAFGSFGNPTVLGPITPGTSNVALPANLPAGTGYRMRVVGGGATVTSLPLQVKASSLSGLTPTVGGAPVCRGSAVTVNFNLPGGSCPFPGGNQFTVQLSSATGSFNNPTNLTTVVAGQANSVVIPATVAAGTGYRIRVVSSQPASTSASSGAFQVKACTNRLSAEEPELVIAPNPVVSGQVRCQVRGMDNPEFTLTTPTGVGVGIWEKTDGSGAWVLTSRQTLAAGVYLLQATEGSARLTARVLVLE